MLPNYIFYNPIIASIRCCCSLYMFQYKVTCKVYFAHHPSLGVHGVFVSSPIVDEGILVKISLLGFEDRFISTRSIEINQLFRLNMFEIPRKYKNHH